MRLDNLRELGIRVLARSSGLGLRCLLKLILFQCNELFACRFEKQDGVVLMATTRSLKQIDEALQRPGRMDRVFHLQRPTQAEREKILHISAKETMDNDLIDFVDWRKVIMLYEYLHLPLPLGCYYLQVSLWMSEEIMVDSAPSVFHVDCSVKTNHNPQNLKIQ